MTDDRPEIPVAQVQALVAAQFPHWAHLPIRPVEPGGWDNRTFHLGDTMSIRMPSAARYAAQVEKEHRWLPRLAPALPLPIPAPLAMGQPGAGYPWPWSIYRWLPGTPAMHADIPDRVRFARDLAAFLSALHRVAADGPSPGAHNFFRGGALQTYDGETTAALETLAGLIDTEAARDVWQTALNSSWEYPQVWVHGDIASGNLLVEEGRLSAVIDFGSSAVGDPACDLTIAWTFFEGGSREAFRDALPLDPATWARARGWALWKALITLATTPDAGEVIETLIAEHHDSD